MFGRRQNTSEASTHLSSVSAHLNSNTARPRLTSVNPRMRIILAFLAFVACALLAAFAVTLPGSAQSSAGTKTQTPKAPKPLTAKKPLAPQLVAPESPASLLSGPTALHFQGNTEDPPQAGAPSNCTGVGAPDIAACNGPFLSTNATLSGNPAAHWDINSALGGANNRTVYDTSWVWRPTGPTQISGPITIEWWADVNATATLIGMEWRIKLSSIIGGPTTNTTPPTLSSGEFYHAFVSGPAVTPTTPGVPQKLTATLVSIPLTDVSSGMVLTIEPRYSDTGAGSHIWYDSTTKCTPATAVAPCDSTITVNVVDPNAVPALSINDVALSEGNSGTKTFTFTVSLSSEAPTGGVTFDIATLDNTATTGDNDYVIHSLTGQSIPAGQQTYNFDVTVNGDTVDEGNQTFFVNVTNVSSGATVADPLGVGTILNDDSSQAAGSVPRYFNYVSPWGDDAGEPSIGSNWGSEVSFSNSMFTIPNGGSSHYFGGFFTYMLKATWDDCSSPANPNFEKKQVLLAGTPRAAGDPILFTDNHTPGQQGRTFVSQLIGATPAGSGTDYTDDDGATFQPSEGAGLPSNVDHQTFGGGPFNPNSNPAPPPHSFPHAIYYCAQSVADAGCSLSLDGGVTFGPAVPIFTVADCTGLHGHIKVAPDGTAYVPNKTCAVNGVPILLGGNAAVIASENNGITWSIRPVPNNRGGQGAGEWDSSVGVATDGTVYLGYQDINNHARMAVSHDRGLTWSQSVDVGVPSASVHVDDVDANGIENMVFPAVVAGDPNRAAFAFYGSDKSDAEGGDHTGGGNDDPLLFSGVWYQYIATTFDGGATWTTVNSTPNDPIQRGSICHDGTCRNLLDFFDIQVDKQGRVLVAGQDGCIGGCVNGPPNSFTAQAFMTRQSGGKRLFAAFDPAEPILAGAPKGSAVVNGAVTAINLSWLVPDHGGATITSYKVYRDDGSGFNLIATVSQPNYTDTATSALGKHYRVTAVNSVGEGPYCHDFISVPGPTETPCIEPGIKVIDDTNPDGSDADSGQNTPADGSVNVRQLRVAEPFLGNGVKKLVFTLQVAPSLLTSPPPNSQWLIIWNRIGGAAADGSDRRYVAMVSNGSGALSFDYGDFGPALPIGGVPSPNANSPTRLGAADSGTYNQGTGVIRIVLDTSKAENITTGQTLAGLNVRTALNRPDYPGFQRSQNNASDITAEGSYTLVGNDVGCLLNQLPRAVLSASPTSGTSPLQVDFTGAASSDPDGTISSYIFTFGDGTPDLEQPTPTVSHTYTCGSGTCNFFASLKVKDNSGELSANTAVVTIEVNGGTAVRTNYALSFNGGSITASSTHSSGNFPAVSAINGDRTGATWGSGNGGWNDGTRSVYNPDILEIVLPGIGGKTIDEINVFTLQNNWTTAGEPTLASPATGEGILDFIVQYCSANCVTGTPTWTTVPDGGVTGNDKAWRQFTFTPVTTTRIRVVVNNSRNNWSRIVELEAFGSGGQ
jgi:PKD domain-containing protein/Calx-beta domain-containing protein